MFMYIAKYFPAQSSANETSEKWYLTFITYNLIYTLQIFFRPLLKNSSGTMSCLVSNTNTLYLRFKNDVGFIEML